MTWTLTVTDHGRWPYFTRMTESLRRLGLEFDRRILALDGVPTDQLAVRINYLKAAGWEVIDNGSTRQGLSANLAQCWGALTSDDEWVFHVESDFLIHDAPLDEMAATLDAFPFVANMVLVRQPWNQVERRFGSVLPTIPGLVDRGGWQEHRKGFWLNPMVAHASLLRSLCPGVEQKLTDQCLARGLSFAYWGGRDDEPRCEHIGVSGGMGSEGWLP